MTALNKQALREAAQEEIMLRSVSDTSDAWPDEASPEAVLALLDENIQLQREKDAIEAVALALRDDMRQAREQLEAAERRMAEQSAIVAAAEKLVRCKGRYHSELNYRALAKLFGVITPDLPPLVHENVHYAEAVEVEISALRQRIAELEAKLETADRLHDSAEPAGYHVIKECGKVGCSVATLEEAEKTRDFWNKKWIIRPYFYTPPARDNKQTDELVMWVKRLAHSLRNARPNSKLHDAAMDYLSCKGLISVEDVLR